MKLVQHKQEPRHRHQLRKLVRLTLALKRIRRAEAFWERKEART